MLTRYKKCHEKIAMGLLSFVQKEKGVQQLKATLGAYKEDASQTLYLWKEGEDFIGVIGVREEDTNCFIQHVSVSPSHRNNGVGHEMIKHIQKKYANSNVIGEEDIVEFCEKCLSLTN